MTYTIERLGVTYKVEPYMDDGEIFAVIHSASGLESFGSDELASMFDKEAHQWLSAELKRRMIAEASEP